MGTTQVAVTADVTAQNWRADTPGEPSRQSAMEIVETSEVGKIAAQHPATTRVFSKHQIDYCCGGGRPLIGACEHRGLDVTAVLGELHQALETSERPPVQWDRAPVARLIEHIIATYHEPLRQELPRLEAMARKVHRVHGDKDPERLAALVDVVAALHAELLHHMAKEERILFPMLKMRQPATAPIRVMEREHDDAGQALAQIRRLTDGFSVPEAACTTWRALWDGLEQLESDLHEHIHLENNILFTNAS